MLLTDAQCGDGSLASHADGGFRMNAEINAGVSRRQERFETIGNGGARSAHVG